MLKWLLGDTPITELIVAAMVLALCTWAFWPKKKSREAETYRDYFGPFR